MPDAPDVEQPADGPRTVRGTVRRAPRYRRFVQVGVLLGVLVAIVLVLVLPAQEGSVGRATVVVFVAGAGALVGALLGAVVALLVDRRSQRRR